MKISTIPGFTAEASLYKTSKHYFAGKGHINDIITKKLDLIQPAVYGCSECILYTEPGPGGRSAGIGTCCHLTCRTTIFGKYRCYEYCTQEVCATFSADEIIV